MTPRRQKAEARLCKAVTKTGRRCATPSLKNGEYCSLHAISAARRSQGGDSRDWPWCEFDKAELMLPESVSDLKCMLAEMMADIRTGTVDPKAAGAYASLGTVLLKVMQTSELDERMAALERVVRASTPKPEGRKLHGIQTPLQRIEASLDPRKKCCLWLDRAKAVGGFESYWLQALRGPLIPYDWFSDLEAFTLWSLINDINFEILNESRANPRLRVLIHVALDGLLRLVARPDPSGTLIPLSKVPEVAEDVGRLLFDTLRELLEEALALAGAIDELSRTHMDGQDLLFADTRDELSKHISKLRTTAQLFEPLAAWLNVEPVDTKDFPPNHPKIEAKAKDLAAMSGAKVLAKRGDTSQFRSALYSVCPELKLA